MLIIGEKINASNKSVGQAIASRDQAFLQNLAIAQSEAGADFIDLNVGVGQDARGNATGIMEWLVDLVQSVCNKPLCIDSDDPKVVEAALRKYRGESVMINSVNAEPERLESIGRLAAERQALLIALVMGEAGIPKSVEERLDAADFMMDRLRKMGVKEDHIFFDPLVLPISVDTTQGLVTLQTIERIKSRYPSAKTVMGLSNISYGLPNRGMVNRVFMLMSASAGLDAAILDPLDTRMMGLIKVADMLTGKDPACRGYIRAYRSGKLSE